MTKNSVWTSAQRGADARSPIAAIDPRKTFEAEFRARALRADAVSFDVFDTLVLRPFERPIDLFEHLTDDVARVLGWRHVDFRTERVDAEREARERNSARGIEDVTLTLIYDVLGERLGWSPEQRATVAALELEAEIMLSSARPSGRRAFAIARELGKRIVLVSDMYLPAAALARLVGRHGYEGYEQLFVSCEVGKSKHSGSMYEHVLAALELAPERLLHVGDNDHSDVARALERKVDALHLPRAEMHFTTAPAFRRVWERDREHHPYAWRAVLATVTQEFGDLPDPRLQGDSLFAGDPHRLGFYGLGPLVLGFTKWVIDRARAAGYEELYFLARDGRVFYEAYRALASAYEGAPPAKYLLCSRRAAHLATVRNEADLAARFAKRFVPTAAATLLEARLGVRADDVAPAIWRAHRLTPDTIVEYEDRGRFVRLVRDIGDVVLARAAEEREAYEAYLESMNFRRGRRLAVVDIGYLGTLQASLDDLLGGGSGLGGLYLITFRDALKNVQAQGMEARGYLGEFVDPNDTDHAFCRHMPLYETLLTSGETSFVRMERAPDGTVRPVHLPQTADERARAERIAEVQRGALEFVERFASAWGSHLPRLDIDPAKALRTLSTYFTAPSAEDARILQGLRFENSFVGASARWVIPPDAQLADAPCVWGEGRFALLDQGDASSTIRPFADAFRQAAAPWVVRAVDRIVPSLLPPAKAAKFRRDPRQFFADSPHRAARVIARMYARRDR